MSAVKPTFSFCVNTNCGKLTITDTTGLWNDTTGIKQWSNSQTPGGVTLDDIITSSLTFTNTATDEEFVFVLKNGTGTDLYPTEASPDFDFTDFDWSAGDGIFNVVLTMTLVEPHTVVAYSDKILITCKAKACVNDLWKKYYVDCNCNGSKDLIAKAQEAEAMLKSAEASFLCNKNTDASKIMKVLDKVCTLSNDCGCN